MPAVASSQALPVDYTCLGIRVERVYRLSQLRMVHRSRLVHMVVVIEVPIDPASVR